MKHARFLASLFLVSLILSAPLFADGVSGARRAASFPTLSCAITSSNDSLYFRGNDYVPNTIAVTVCVTNTSAVDTAFNVECFLVKDTRFIIVGDPKQLVDPALLPGATACVNYRLDVADARVSDGYDTLRAVISAGGANAICEYPLWVEHEYFPIFRLICQREFAQIEFVDSLNSYVPNPFGIGVEVTNLRDGAADSTFIQFLGTRGVSVDTTGSSIIDVGTLQPGAQFLAQFKLNAIKRLNDTTVTLCFQVVGKGGYKRKTYIDSCCIDVFIPQAKQAAYTMTCSLTDTQGTPITRIDFLNHRYQPDPFLYTVVIENTGTADGRNVRAQYISFPGLQIDQGEIITKALGDIPTGGKDTVTWQLRPTIHFKLDTVQVCMRVYDEFENASSICCPLIIDSIRSARFIVSCLTPDSIKVDSLTGLYTPAVFTVSFTVCNVGSDYADSVKGTLIIQTPDVNGMPPFVPIKTKVVYSGSDTLGVGSCYTFTWDLEALPRAVSGFVSLKFKADATNAESKESECRIFIPQLEAPDLAVICETDPVDTVRYDPDTGGYTPPFIRYQIRVTNPGGGVARNVRATLTLPPTLAFATGDSSSKFVIPSNVGPTDTALALWLIVPQRPRDVGSLLDIRVEVTADNVAGRFPRTCSVFVSPIPKTAALVIPQNNVGYTNQEIKVPIFIDDPEQKGITRFDCEIHYNVDAQYIPLPKRVVRLASQVPRENADVLGTLLQTGWDVTITAVSDNLMRLQAVNTNGTPLRYPDLGPGQAVPPLVFIRFVADFGLRPDDLKIAQTHLLWPTRPIEVLQHVLINNGDIFPRVSDGLLTVAGDCLRPLKATDDYVISQNSPNPFNPTTMIAYGLPETAHVRLTVFDAFGRTVSVLVDEVLQKGMYTAEFNSAGLPSGLYFYRMETPKYSKTLKMVVAK